LTGEQRQRLKDRESALEKMLSGEVAIPITPQQRADLSTGIPGVGKHFAAENRAVIEKELVEVRARLNPKGDGDESNG